VFGRSRGDVESRRQLVRAELGQSWDHALRAAGHAATGVRSTVGPRVAPAAARVRSAATDRWGSTKAAFAPLAEAAQQQLKRDRKRGGKVAGRRWPKVAGLLAGGALVGGAAAFVMRRRRQQQWEEYDPTAAVSEVAEAAEEAEAAGAPGPTGLGEEQPAVSDNRRV
jgi:hypothetical protein